MPNKPKEPLLVTLGSSKGAALYEAMLRKQSLNIRRIRHNRAEQVGYSRFLENEQGASQNWLAHSQTTASRKSQECLS